MISVKRAVSLLQRKKPRHPWPARILHWIFAPAVLVCAYSGSYISGPSRFYGFRSMDSARKTHLIANNVLIWSYLARVYYGYAANNYGEIVPTLKDLKDTPGFFKYELFLTKKKPKFPKYNPLQKIIYTAMAILVPVQGITGLAFNRKDSWQKTAVLAGGLNPLRRLHYLTAFALNNMVAGHTYFVVTDSLKKLKSIFTGYE